jgi:hypothetical protein
MGLRRSGPRGEPGCRRDHAGSSRPQESSGRARASPWHTVVRANPVLVATTLAVRGHKNHREEHGQARGTQSYGQTWFALRPAGSSRPRESSGKARASPWHTVAVQKNVSRFGVWRHWASQQWPPAATVPRLRFGL